VSGGDRHRAVTAFAALLAGAAAAIK